MTSRCRAPGAEAALSALGGSSKINKKPFAVKGERPKLPWYHLASCVLACNADTLGAVTGLPGDAYFRDGVQHPNSGATFSGATPVGLQPVTHLS